MFTLLLLILITVTASYDASNRCHIKKGDRLFYLKPLQVSPYYIYDQVDGTDLIFLFNFCTPFTPTDPFPCPSTSYSFVLNPHDSTCQSYSSDSKMSMYYTEGLLDESGKSTGITIVEYTGLSLADQKQMNRTTNLTVMCGENQGFEVEEVYLSEERGSLVVIGRSRYGCPVLEISRLWEALHDNAILFGIVMVAVGVMELLFGRKMLQPTIFVAAYCLTFAIVGAFVSEIILGPDSSLLVIYFSLLGVLFISSFVAYLVMGISPLSIFCIGAWMGLIVAALANSIFIKIFNIYSTWSLVGFAIFFCLLLGLLSYRMYNQIVIMSTSLTGAYLIIRPISWIFGGFPNEFMLAKMIQAGELSTLPSLFFVYFGLIVLLSIVGDIYQFLQLKRERAAVEGSIEVGLVEGKIESGIDSVRNSINSIINKYKTNEEHNDGYVEFQEFKRLSSEKPLYPNLQSSIIQQQRPVSDKIRDGSISISKSFLKDSLNKSPQQLPERQSVKSQSQPQPRQVDSPIKRISTHSDDSRPSRDVNALRSEIKSSGNRFSMERLTDSMQLGAMVPNPGFRPSEKVVEEKGEDKKRPSVG